MIRGPPRSTRTDTLVPDTTLVRSLRARIAASAAAGDQAGARQGVESAQALGLSRANLRKLAARANDIPAPGEPLDRLPGDMVLPAIAASDAPLPAMKNIRSEEHTSELQSLMRNSYAVFC